MHAPDHFSRNLFIYYNRLRMLVHWNRTHGIYVGKYRRGTTGWSRHRGGSRRRQGAGEEEGAAAVGGVGTAAGAGTSTGAGTSMYAGTSTGAGTSMGTAAVAEAGMAVAGVGVALEPI